MQNLKNILLMSACAVSLSACVSFKDYKEPVNPLGASEVSFVDLDDKRYQQASPISKWWSEFDDPMLGDLIERSLRTNLDARIAMANLLEARSLSRHVGFDRVPTVNTNASYNRQRLSEDGVGGTPPDLTVSNYDAGVSALWELDLFGRVSENIKAQKALEGQALADLQNMYVLIAAEVARTYVELRGAQYRLDIAQRNADNQESTYKLTQTLSNGGRATELDVSRAKTQLEVTKSTIPPLKAQVTASINRLSVLTGRVPDALSGELAGVKPLPSLPMTVAVGNAEELLKRRPDIRSAERALASSIARYNVAVTEFFPKVSLSGSLGFAATDLGSFGSGTGTASIGPSLSWRALDFGRVRAEIDQADARATASLNAYEKTVLEALEETQTSLSNFTREEERRLTLQEAARSAKKSAELAKLRFNKGVDGFLDVLDAERTLLDTEDALAASEVAAAVNLIAIYKSIGGGWQVK